MRGHRREGFVPSLLKAPIKARGARALCVGAKVRRGRPPFSPAAPFERPPAFLFV